MKTANILLHKSAHYKAEIFGAGLKKHGYRIINDRNYRPQSTNDVLLLWNRNPPHERIAALYESEGARVIVSENGYIGEAKALAQRQHNGAGGWFVGEKSRWPKFNINLMDWRENGEHILVLPQRSIGSASVAMPRPWLCGIQKRLQKITDRPIRVRRHPGTTKSRPLELDLGNAWCAVTWGSGAGIKAICAGIPVFYDFAKWIGAPAATCNFDLEKPYLGDRMQMLHRLSWAQWTWEEIERGEPFKWLL